MLQRSQTDRGSRIEFSWRTDAVAIEPRLKCCMPSRNVPVLRLPRRSARHGGPRPNPQSLHILFLPFSSSLACSPQHRRAFAPSVDRVKDTLYRPSFIFADAAVTRRFRARDLFLSFCPPPPAPPFCLSSLFLSDSCPCMAGGAAPLQLHHQPDRALRRLRPELAHAPLRVPGPPA
jgi:hypothetical protein